MTDINQSNNEKLLELINVSAEASLLKKTVFSKPQDKSIRRAELTLKIISGERVLQLESFYSDNKAKHRNIPLSDFYALLEIIAAFGQINLLTSAGDCELKRSKSGNSTLIGADKLLRALSADTGEFKRIDPTANNKRKRYVLDGSEPFLKLLEVSDKNGRVYDKKQAKFRQINRFLELIRDVESALPDGELRICDLCCGKSYLSFAVYHYFSVIKGRRVKMTGVDLKEDVIGYCSDVARKLGFDGLEFICGDVSLYSTDDKVNMVISLHACDTATDIVIGKGIEWRADVILSTPCCHHELNRKLDCPSLDFIAQYSMLKQKLCDAATDAMRLKLLEANGYETAALELIDPEETPKNIMLRGIRRFDPEKEPQRAAVLLDEYERIRNFLMGGYEQ